MLAVTEEMKTNLTRTAYNMIIYEALDFTVGLFTAKGETISIGLGLPTFIRGMAETINSAMRFVTPIMLVGFTALSVETRTKRSTPAARRSSTTTN